MPIDMITVKKFPEKKTQTVKFEGLDPSAVWVKLTPKDETTHGMQSEVSEGKTRPDDAIELDEGKLYRLRSYSKLVSAGVPDENSALPGDKQVYVDPANGTLLVAANVKSLLELVVESLYLDWDKPRKDCDGGKALHKAWLDHLDAAYKPSPGVTVSDNAGAYETINGLNVDAEGKPIKPKTSCSQTVGTAFRNFGIPGSYLGGSPSKALVAFPGDDGNERGYVHKITPNSLPRAGDPYYLVNSETNKAGSPSDHHAIFGKLIGTPKDPPPYKVGDYSGGQARTGTKENPTSKDKYDALFSQRTLTMKGSDIYASGLSTGGAGEVPGGFRRVMVYTDMWKFFQDAAAGVTAGGVTDPGKGKRGSLK